MKVTLSKYGGLAAGMRRPPKVVDSKDLSAADAQELARLVQAAMADPATTGEAASSAGPARDAMRYRIEIEDGGETRTLSASDGSLSATFAALRDWLERRSP